MNKFTSFLLCTFVFSAGAIAQPNVKPANIPNGWHLKDQATTGFYGISLDKAYDFLKSKKIQSKTVTVAVIDGGIDTTQEDLKAILWTNPREIPGNGIDDDKNGYVDDVHGWNFLGNKDGRNVKEDSYEAARVYYSLKNKWQGKDEASVSVKDRAEYQMFLAAKQKVVGDVDVQEAAALKQILPRFKAGDSIIRKELGKEEYNGNDVKNYRPQNQSASFAKAMVLNISKANDNYDITNTELIGELEGEIRKAESASVAPPNYRGDIVGDDENNINDRFYGNNDVMSGTPMHGTHCAGIIGAIRNNNKGVDGVADNVRIMMVRAVPDGDEHDKDIANAIRYAVDNGAKIISMSFGKDFSPEKRWVDDAFRYAESKGVLLVKAAGNDNKNIDSLATYPSSTYLDGKGRASNVITVGASGDPLNGGLVAKFSNFGKKEVDVFAPGVNIYSTIPGTNNYGNLSGTSMACPVVAGVAALLLEYYPNLTPQQLKLAIEKSAVAPGFKATNPETGDQVELSDISKTGGLVNAYGAVMYASTIKTGTPAKTLLPKSKIKKAKKG